MVHTALQAHPELLGRPIVVGGAPSEPKPVLACSAEAAAMGVRPGMRLKEAQSCCPRAIFLPAMPEQVHEMIARLGRVLVQVSPDVEPAMSGLFFLAVEGLQRLWPREEALAAHVRELIAAEGLSTSHIGIADTKFAALVAALSGELCIVPAGEDAQFLSEQPIEWLPAPPQTIAALRALGIYSLGAFAGLPSNAVVMRFGKDAGRLQRLARGHDDAQVVAPVTRPPLEARAAFEGGATVRDRIMWRLEQKLAEIYRSMERAQLAARTLRLTLIVEDGAVLRHVLPLADPLWRLPQLQQLLRWLLERLELPGPVVEMVVELADLAPLPSIQPDLFARQAEGDPRKLLGELLARWGAEGIVQPQLVPSRRAETAFTWTRPAGSSTPPRPAAPCGQTVLIRPQPILRLLPTPRPVKVTLCNGQPASITLRHRKERVVAAGGPWRLCESWWDTPVERDEYQLCTETAVYYVVHDRLGNTWSLLGAFD